MKKNYLLNLFVCCILFACGSDDSSITPVSIETQPDSVSLSQNSQIEIFIFANDSNIPTLGTLSLTNPTKGFVEIIDNGTPNNPSDDYIKYSVNPNETGTDNFEYTICSSSNDCKTEIVSIEITTNSNVVYNLENMPYDTLSEYQFFEGDLKNLDPSFGVVPYTLNSTLFTDYAKKKRFIWMPNNTKATYTNDNVPLNFPVGSIIIKNFYYDNVLPSNETKIIETRLMIRKNEGWIFANYVWNTVQTEALLDMNGSFVNIEWLEGGETKSTQYRIPSESQCFTCHKVTETPELIGPKPRNLNLDYTFEDGVHNQLNKLISLGYLENNLPNNISATPNYHDQSIDLELRVRAYLDINCAHCHTEETHCSYRPIRLSFTDTENLTNIGICVDPDTELNEDLSHIIEPGDARSSVLHYRINSTEPSEMMPLLGRTIVHVEGVELIEEWIDSLTINCD